ncbi:MAG: restriction endonuclease subunit S [Candidatus Jorgensenbacteria bacterium]|nr:restriction endonuclease subunit S [Candidatus Jorgensenbacteria bacterium]
MATKDFQIKDILDFQKKSHRKAGDGLASGKYPFFTSSQLQTKWFDEADYKIEAIILGTGGAPSVHCSKNFSTSADVFILATKDSNISTKYVCYFLQGNKNLLARGFKGAGLKHLSRDYTTKINIPIPIDNKGNPDIKEQDRIVALLEKAEELKRKRAEADKKMATVIPALFSQMFGDLNSNPMKWPVVLIGSVVDETRGVKCGPFGSALKRKEYVSDGIPVWGIQNMKPNKFIEDGPLFITEEKFNHLLSYKVESGDLLISRAGTVGMVCVARPTKRDSIIGTNLIRVALDQKVIVPEFLSTLMNEFKSKSRELKVDANEGSYSFVSTKGIKKINIYLPPIDLQKEFTDRAKEILTFGEKQKRSTANINGLFSSLLAGAFVTK